MKAHTANTATPTIAATDDVTGNPRLPHGLHVETWGQGERVVLVHGSLATGAEEWAMQQPLADAGFELIVPDRRGYGGSAGPVGEDFLVDADDIATLMGDGAHLVGHSYGGLGVLLAAARRPDATRSMTLLEPAVVRAGATDPAWRAIIDQVEALWGTDLDVGEWVTQFLTIVGSDPRELPEGLLDAAIELAPVFRNGRPIHECDPPFAELAAATFPKLVVSGGHHDGFDAMCSDLATRIGATEATIVGAGHEIQFVGEPLNEVLSSLWHTV